MEIQRDASAVETDKFPDEEVWGVEELGEYLSDEESVGQEEWRDVRATDKELRRYLVSCHSLSPTLKEDAGSPLIAPRL